MLACILILGTPSPWTPSLLQDREVVVREPTGVLREATWEERDRMMQVYFPSLGRRMWLPHMLTEEGLLPVLEAGRYGDILDMACIQREPDSEDYIRVSTTRVYPFTLIYRTIPITVYLCYLLLVPLNVSNAHPKAKLLSFLPELDWTCI
jgi:hypothetical protein